MRDTRLCAPARIIRPYSGRGGGQREYGANEWETFPIKDSRRLVMGGRVRVLGPLYTVSERAVSHSYSRHCSVTRIPLQDNVSVH